MDPATGRVVNLFRAQAIGCVEAAGVPDGSLFAFLTDSNLAIRNDKGEIVADVPPPLEYGWQTEGGALSWSFDGHSLIAESGEYLYVIHLDGSTHNIEQVTGLASRFTEQPVLSPDGIRIAFISSTVGKFLEPSQSHVWVMNSDGSSRRQLDTPVWPTELSWSPDSRNIAFDYALPTFGPRGVGISGINLGVVPADGGSSAVTLCDGTGPICQGDPPSFAWSPDSRGVAVVVWRNDKQTAADLLALPPEGGPGQVLAPNLDTDLLEFAQWQWIPEN